MTTKFTKGINYYQQLKKLLKNAHGTYSHINVAAIIVTDKGVFKGVNYEDCINSLSVCAERNAIFNAVTNGMKEIYEIHIISDYPNIEMCGVCRQLALSFMKLTNKVYSYDLKTGKRWSTTLGQLMPKATHPSKK